ncbi:hypothetical protein [Acidovorax sp.]|uniref:hypothetical protein n=1 Tax=Acidovorax sp. TaxID=1872122 RepID=UPI0025BDDD20|nr:hypothetical protein [Acidovorax sp.]MCI5069739.1 hypothetical protein [Acidovorax sp.]
MDTTKHWLDYVTAIGSLATPLIVLLLTAVGWKLRQSIERRRDLENKLHADRIDTYNKILEPFIILLMSDTAWGHDIKHKGQDKNDFAMAKMMSLECRNTSFKLSLVGSDAVVTAFNNLFQFFFEQGSDSVQPPDRLRHMLSLLGTFLLEIRRSMGNESSKLTNWQMLEWFITDARKYSK